MGLGRDIIGGMNQTTDNRMVATLREAFTQSGLSVNALVKRAGTTYGNVYRFIHNGADLHLRVASKLAEALGLELRPIVGKRKRVTRGKT